MRWPELTVLSLCFGIFGPLPARADPMVVTGDLPPFAIPDNYAEPGVSVEIAKEAFARAKLPGL
jgi:hypothetical protein